jgi:hypothetical protein
MNPAPGPVAKVSVPLTFYRVLSRPFLRGTALRCITSVFANFFFLQWRSSFLPGRIPVTGADHALDGKIPFVPGKVNIYLDFIAFWVRCLGFLLKHCGRRAWAPVRDFLDSMGKLYSCAAEVYSKNLSTTKRPFYIRRPQFLLIHLMDPHLMCIPSLHVMVVIRTYTFFAETIKKLNEEKKYAAQAEELRLGALAITEAVLYIKKHSVNCISAALYAMTSFDRRLFPPEEAERFVSLLFDSAKEPDKSSVVEIRDHILSLYRQFLAQGETARNWTLPLLNFLGCS